MPNKEEKKVNEMDEWYRNAQEANDKWRTQAKEDKDFYWTKQWSEEDREKLIKEKRKLLDKVSKALLEKETLDRDQFEKIVGKKENGVK